MTRKTKKPKCITTSDIVLWSVAGYAAYLAALWIWKKPVCEFTDNLCRKITGEQP